jgi:hypothetical protein
MSAPRHRASPANVAIESRTSAPGIGAKVGHVVEPADAQDGQAPVPSKQRIDRRLRQQPDAPGIRLVQASTYASDHCVCDRRHHQSASPAPRAWRTIEDRPVRVRRSVLSWTDANRSATAWHGRATAGSAHGQKERALQRQRSAPPSSAGAERYRVSTRSAGLDPPSSRPAPLRVDSALRRGFAVSSQLASAECSCIRPTADRLLLLIL